MAPYAGAISLSPCPTYDAPRGMVCAVDHLAAGAGAEVLREGGNAVDAAIATNAVLAVTTQQMCGAGGDLWAVVSVPGAVPVALNASGFAGAGSTSAALRAAGHRSMPRTGLAPVTVPGCVDGWCSLADRFATMPLSRLLAPAVRYARDGFPASPPLVAALPEVAHLPEAADYRAHGALMPGALVRRPGVARTFEAIGAEGRDGFYGGAFGAGLLELGAGQFSRDDMLRPISKWTPAISADACGHRLWTVPPNSQGYLTLAAASIASGLQLPDEPADPLWAHLLIESARQASFDRLQVLSEDADAASLLGEGRLGPRRIAIDPTRAARLGERYGSGDTTAITVVDSARMGVTIVQSNASGWGARVAEPATRIFLHNRGLGFSLEEGHPAELVAGRRPPHTLCPTLVTSLDGVLEAVVGAAGGDAQPQFLLQLLARALRGAQRPGDAIGAGRWSLANQRGGEFNTWEDAGTVTVLLEDHAPSAWDDGLRAKRHLVERVVGDHSAFGIAQLITVGEGVLSGATDPRSFVGGVAAH